MAVININPSDYPSNTLADQQRRQMGNQNRTASNTNQPRRPRVQKSRVKQVVSNGSVVNGQKKSLMDEFKSNIVRGEKVDIGTYLVRDVLVPTIQNTILDYLSIRFFGTSQPGRNRNYGYGGRSLLDYGREIFNYGGIYSSGPSSAYGRSTGIPNQNVNPTQPRMDYRQIILLDAESAKRVVDNLRGRILKYNEATVGDLYNSVGLTATVVDDNWGWINTNDIGIKRVPEGWLIDVADAIYLER